MPPSIYSQREMYYCVDITLLYTREMCTYTKFLPLSYIYIYIYIYVLYTIACTLISVCIPLRAQIMECIAGHIVVYSWTIYSSTLVPGASRSRPGAHQPSRVSQEHPRPPSLLKSSRSPSELPMASQESPRQGMEVRHLRFTM